MNLMVTVDKNWAIGNMGQLLVSVPEAQRMMRDETLSKVIVMSRKVLESLPGKQPLYGRTNIVMTRDPEYKAKGVIICHSMTEVLKELQAYPTEDVFIIGGASIYEQFFPLCDVAHVTYIDYEYSADAYFPDLSKDGDWEFILESDEQTYFNLCYTFQLYNRK